VSVVGLGYIGLPTAAVFANRGVDVVGVDVDPGKVEMINRGEVPIEEPDLDVMVHAAVVSGKLRATLEPEPADAFLVAVPTPLNASHEPDLSYVQEAARRIAPVLKRGDLVVLESTSPVGTTEAMARTLGQSRADLSFPQDAGEGADVQVAYCPERVLPGRILIELVDNDRVIGGMTPHCTERAIMLYETFVVGRCIATDVRTAEMTKLVENSFRDVNIAYANELSIICDNLGINVWELIELANRHPRVNILQPGPGVGGHCIAVDPWFIVHNAGPRARLIRTARDVNDSKPEFVLSKVEAALAGNAEPRVACLGLAFKADVDDLRESPAVFLVDRLASIPDVSIRAVEPYIAELPPMLARHGNVSLATDANGAIAWADLVVVLVNHNQFKHIDRGLLVGKDLIDTRGMWIG
jgi:UDP-N-acetyl-D-mannosaminuronic acid dehydrogenase